MNDCNCVKLVKVSGPFESGKRYVCECGKEYRVTPWGEFGIQFGTQQKQQSQKSKGEKANGLSI